MDIVVIHIVLPFISTERKLNSGYKTKPPTIVFLTMLSFLGAKSTPRQNNTIDGRIQYFDTRVENMHYDVRRLPTQVFNDSMNDLKMIFDNNIE